MGKCQIIGKIRVPAQVGQAIRINDKKCDEETVWNLSAYGGESHVTDFTLEVKANVDFDIEFDISTATDGEYTVTVLESDGVTEVSSPTEVLGQTVYNWKLKIDFDKYITDDTYEIIWEVDYV